MSVEGLRDFICDWLPAGPAQVLDVGCGDGRLTRWLRGRGYTALGLDPAAPREVGFEQGRLEDLHRPLAFDAAVAVGSLHHLDDPEAAVDALAGSLRPGARLVVSEFAVEAHDERSDRWLECQGLVPQRPEPEGEHLVRLTALRELLERRLRQIHLERTPYLAVEYRRHDLVEAEAGAIAAGELPAIGARLVYELIG